MSVWYLQSVGLDMCLAFRSASSLSVASDGVIGAKLVPAILPDTSHSLTSFWAASHEVRSRLLRIFSPAKEPCTWMGQLQRLYVLDVWPQAVLWRRKIVSMCVICA